MTNESETTKAPITVESKIACDCQIEVDLPEEISQLLDSRDAFSHNPEEFKQDQVPFLGFSVDSNMRGVIQNLWVMGFPTDSSCEGYIELCHPEFQSSEFYTRIRFLKVHDAISFYTMLTEIFGPGTDFGPEGFSLTSTDGSMQDLIDAGMEDTPDFFESLKSRVRGEVVMHPEYLNPLADFLNKITAIGELDERRSELEISEDLDESYEVLNISPELRRLAEKAYSRNGN